MPCRLRIRTAALLALTLAVVPGHAQQPADSQPPKPTFRTEASYVRVDVFATLNGVPVRDLKKDDFEIFEDGAPQQVEQFELIEVMGNVPQEQRREPRTVSESREMAQEPRARVFIIFLDTYHVDVAGSHRMRTSLSTMLRRVLGPDDLVGVMTPEMSAADVTLARRTEVTEGMLETFWNWGRRNERSTLDPEEEAYIGCFGNQVTQTSTGGMIVDTEAQVAGVANEMIERRREKLTLEALEDLVRWLRGVREERKAVLTVSDGWRLFRPNRALENSGRPPGPGGLGTGPTGGLTADVGAARSNVSSQQCERDRMYLASLDNDTDFRHLLDRANRANVTFYPIDPRGLPVFDSPIGGIPGQPGGAPLTSPSADASRLQQRIGTLQTMAAATDGLAVVNSNDIDSGLKRIAADLSSYYLLGYYSTNDRLDGRFRSIKVRLKRPGVTVRARRGYLAATPAEMSAAPAATEATPVTGSALALERALAGLAGLRPDARVRMHVSWLAPSATPSPANHVWAIAELDRTLMRGAEWAGGAKIEATLSAADGAKVATRGLELAAGQRSAAIDVTDIALPAGELLLRLRIAPVAGGLPLVESLRFTVPEGAASVGAPRLWRRGPETGPQFVLTGNAAFRRSETLRLELPVAGTADSVAADLLDRTGKVMPIPVATRLNTPTPELTWATGELALAPLAAGDYAVRTTVKTSGGTREVLTGFRVIP